MRRFAKWHIWLGWLVGFPILMWTVTGLVMVWHPIEHVRGSHLRVESEQALLPAESPEPIVAPFNASKRYAEMRLAMQDDRPVWYLTDSGGNLERVAADGPGEPLPVIDEAYIREAAARQIVGGDNPVAIEQFSAEQSPFDFRRPIPSWRVTLEDGAHIYFDARTGELAAVRTRWWRVFDFMWGLHIMDLQTRELDQQSPFNYAMLVIFAALAVIGALLGTILMFRRRKARVKA